MNHYGMPGPGGSLGRCAVCGEDFAAGVIKDLMGMPSDIESFQVGFCEQMLYAHKPNCTDALKKAFEIEEPKAVFELLPEGPLKKVLGEAIAAQAEGENS